MLVYWLDIIGTAVFAISGVLLAGKLRMDPFGVLVLGVVTAVGGGTIRDMALANGPVFWVQDPTVLVVACLLYTPARPRDRTTSRMPSSA